MQFTKPPKKRYLNAILEDAMQMMKEYSSIPRIIAETARFKEQVIKNPTNKEFHEKFRESEKQRDNLLQTYHMSMPIALMNQRLSKFKRKTNLIEELENDFSLPIKIPSQSDLRIKGLFKELDLDYITHMNILRAKTPRYSSLDDMAALGKKLYYEAHQIGQFILGTLFALSSEKDYMIKGIREVHGGYHGEELINCIIMHSLQIRSAMLHSEYVGDSLFQAWYDHENYSSIRHAAFEIREDDYNSEYKLKEANKIIDDMQEHKMHEKSNMHRSRDVIDVLASLVISVPEIRDRAREYYNKLAIQETPKFDKRQFDEKLLVELVHSVESLTNINDNLPKITIYENLPTIDDVEGVDRITKTCHHKYFDRVLLELKNNPVKCVKMENGEDARIKCINHLKELAERFNYPIEKIKEAEKYPLSQSESSYVEKINEKELSNKMGDMKLG